MTRAQPVDPSGQSDFVLRLGSDWRIKFAIPLPPFIKKYNKTTNFRHKGRWQVLISKNLRMSFFAHMCVCERYKNVTYCSYCPPTICVTCGGKNSLRPEDYSSCACWTDLRTMPLADIKAIFARDGLSIDIQPEPEDDK